MFIPQSTVLVNPTSHLLELRGKALGGLFGGSKKLFELSSEHPQIIKHWIDILGPMALQQETAVINTPLPTTFNNNDNRSIHSKILSPEDDNVQQSTSFTTDAVGDNTIAAIDAEHQQQETTMQPIVQGESSTTHNNITDDDDDDDFRNQTIEYSTHSPIHENPPMMDEHNPFVNNTNNKSGESLQGTVSSESPSTPIATTAEITTEKHHPPGPTREGSELYWDSNTTPLPTPQLGNQHSL
jgi:hypothetical protein